MIGCSYAGHTHGAQLPGRSDLSDIQLQEHVIAIHMQGMLLVDHFQVVGLAVRMNMVVEELNDRYIAAMEIDNNFGLL